MFVQRVSVLARKSFIVEKKLQKLSKGEGEGGRREGRRVTARLTLFTITPQQYALLVFLLVLFAIFVVVFVVVFVVSFHF